MSAARLAPGLLAGVALYDILVNLPGFSAASPVASLLSPSLDLLVALALLLSAARGTPRVRTGFAVAVSVLLGLVVGLRAYLRWGAPGLPAGPLVAVASFFLSRLAYPGFADPVLRNLFLLAIALCAVIQALLGARIFSPSAVPGVLRWLGGGLR